jgi:phosphopantothenoylcysteine decarboxylase/phosphopantothenate--cysteine ligase
MKLENQRILLAVSAGIAAYKAPQLVRELCSAGAQVRVILTEDAQKLVAPLALQAVSGHPVQTSLWDGDAGFAMDHIELAKWATVVLIAPATANVLAKLAAGIADDLLTTLALATQARLFVAPAMNQAMWRHAATTANVACLQQRGVVLLGPDSGEQACGDVGPGRMREPSDLVSDLVACLSGLSALTSSATGSRSGTSLCEGSTCLQGKTVLITAGPTREAWDPVRFLTNHSTGRMGFALAAAAQQAGAHVILIAGPVQLPIPMGVKRIDIVTADEMAIAVDEQVSGVDLFIAAAAVADFRPARELDSKLKKDGNSLTLELEPTIDIVAAVASRSEPPFVVGFAAETDQVIDQAKAKRERKGMDLIVANQVGADCGFGDGEVSVTLIGEGMEQTLAAHSKETLAPKLIALIAAQWPVPQPAQ